MRSTSALMIAAGIAAFTAACGGPAANSGIVGTPAANANTAILATNSANANAPAASPVAVAKSGEDLYTINCMTCHKDSGKGGKVTVDGKQLDPDDLTSANMKAKTDDKLIAYVTDGIPDEGMPAFKDKLKPEEIKLIVAHVRELQRESTAPGTR